LIGVTDGVAAPSADTRHITLDAVRGFAVMGILAMNIVDFAMPESAYISPAVYGGSQGINLASWIFSALFFDGKMRGLFSLLFGASLLLVINRADAKGEDTAKVHFSRMAWLMVFGLVHYFLIWSGDILFTYACIGCIAYLFRNCSVSRLIRTAIIIFVVGSAMNSIQFGLQYQEQLRAQVPGAPAALVQQYEADKAQSTFAAKETARQIALHRSGYTDIVAEKWKSQFWMPLIGVIMGLLETLPLMLLGMALFKNGFLTGEWEEPRYRRIVYWTLPTGLALTAVIIFIEYISGFDEIVMWSAMFGWSVLPHLAVTIAYAAILMVFVRRVSASAFLKRVVATGRMAFSNYLGTSIVMTTIFYGYGLGLFGHIGRAGLWPFVLGAWIIMLSWSKPWLIRFRYGPLEWLWRSLARGTLQPMRR
jgi:uncharacterized protein